MTSKSQRIVDTRKELIHIFVLYAKMAYDWNLREEEDISDLNDGIDEILERNPHENQL